jgi:hypothetical protein
VSAGEALSTPRRRALERERCRVSQPGIWAEAKPWLWRIPREEKSIGVLDDHGHFLGLFPQFGMTHTNLGKVMEML